MQDAPQKKKLPWWAILLIVFGVLSLIGVAVIGGIVWWISANKDRILAEGTEAMAEAHDFAQTHDQNGCVDEGLRKASRCDGLMCETNARVFTSQCIREAERTPGFCDDVPEPTAVMKMSRWATAECKRRGKSGNQRCARVVQAVPDACHTARLGEP